MKCDRCKRWDSHYTDKCRAKTFADGNPIGRSGGNRKSYTKKKTYRKPYRR